jgi:hypothetical protein
VGNLLEPRMLGTRLGVSPFVILLGMLFWGWLWGPVGALLAVPILVATKIVLENTPGWAWLGALADSSAKRLPSARKIEIGRSAGFGLGADSHAASLTRPGFRTRKPVTEPSHRAP